MKLVGFKRKDQITGEDVTILDGDKANKETRELENNSKVDSNNEGFASLTKPVNHETYFLALAATEDAKEHDGDETEFGDYKCRIFTNKTLLDRIDEGANMMVIEVTDEALSDMRYECEVGTVAKVNGKFNCMYLWTDKTLAHLKDLGLDLHGNNECILRTCLHLGMCKETVLQLLADIDDKTRCLGELFDSVAELGDKEIFEALLKRTHKVDKSKYALFIVPDAVDLKQVVQDYPSNDDFDFELNKQLNENFSKTVGSDIEGFAKQHGLEVFKPMSKGEISADKYEWELYDPRYWRELFRLKDGYAISYLYYTGESPYVVGRWGIHSLDFAFEDNKSLKYVDLRLMNLSRCRSMNRTFAGCCNLKYVNIVNVTEPVSIGECNLAFADCSSLIGLSCDQFLSPTISRCHDIAWMFTNCKNLDISMLDTVNMLITQTIKRVMCDTKVNALYEMNGVYFKSDDLVDCEKIMQVGTIYKGCNLESIYDGTYSQLYSQEDKDIILDTEFTEEFRFISENVEELRNSISYLENIQTAKLRFLNLWSEYEQRSQSDILTSDEAELSNDVCHSMYIPNIIPIKQLVKEYKRRKKYRDNLEKRVSRLLLAETGSDIEKPGIWDEISDEVLGNYGFKVFVDADGHREIYDPKLWSCDGLDYLAYIGDDPYVVGRYNARYMDYAFAGSYFEYLDLSGLNLSLVESMHGMFSDCNNLLYTRFLGLENTGCLSNVKDLDYLYANCVSLLEVDLKKVWSKRDTSFYSLCYNCESLEVVNGLGYIAEEIWDCLGADRIAELMLEDSESIRVAELVEYINEIPQESINEERLSMSLSALLGCDSSILVDTGDSSILNLCIIKNEDDLRDLLNGETPYLRNAIAEAKGFLARVIETLKKLRDAAKEAIDDAITEIDHELNVAVQSVDDSLNAVSQKVDDINTAAGQVADGFRNAAQAVKDGVSQAGNTMRGDKQ